MIRLIALNHQYLCMKPALPLSRLKIILCSILFISSYFSQAQTIRTVGSGGDYTNLTTAFQAINNGVLTGEIELQIISNTTEANSTQLNESGSGSANYTSVYIYPTGGAPRTVGGNLSLATIYLNGADNVRINGLNTGGNSLTISNSSTNTGTILLTNDAQNNIIENLTVTSANTNITAPARGNISFTGPKTGGTGNSNNVIRNCNIQSGMTGIFAIGSTGFNTNNTIENNNIYDFLSNLSGSTAMVGINLQTGNRDWTISGNSFYFTNAVSTTTSDITFIYTTGVGGGFTITDNYFGGRAPMAGGAAMTINHSGSITGLIAIHLSNSGSELSSVQGNTVTNIVYSTSSTAAAYGFTGIFVASGRVQIGNVEGNLFGSTTVANSISLTGSSFTEFFGIQIRAVSGVNLIQNNVVCGIQLNGSGGMRGIFSTSMSAGAELTVEDNTIGSETLSNAIAVTTTGSSNGIYGMWLSGNNAYVCRNNILSNFTHAGTSNSVTLGIRVGLEASGQGLITGNRISVLKSATSGSFADLSGIEVTQNGNGTATLNLENNEIFDLANTNSGATGFKVRGIYVSGAGNVSQNRVQKNLIHTIYNNNRSGTSFHNLGIEMQSYAGVVANNVIHLGTLPNGSSFDATPRLHGLYASSPKLTDTLAILHNTVYLGGNVTVVSSYNQSPLALALTFNGPILIANNIFSNERTLSGGTINPNTDISTIYYFSNMTSQSCFGTSSVNRGFSNVVFGTNMYYTAGPIQYMNVMMQTFDNFTNQYWDKNSFIAQPTFVNKTGGIGNIDLRIDGNVSTPVEGAGLPYASVTDDFLGQNRASLGAADLGAYAGNYTLSDQQGPFLDYTTIPNRFTHTGIDPIISNVRIRDLSGVASGSNAPRLYYRKNNTGAWFSVAGNLVQGTTTDGQYDFNFDVSLAGGFLVGDFFDYYIVTQDGNGFLKSFPNGVVGAGVNTITTHPTLTVLNRVASVVSLSGSYSVGASGDFTSLDLALRSYEFSPINGPVSFELMETNYDGGTNGFFIPNNPDASSTNTLTIKPASGVNSLITSSSTTATLTLGGSDFVTIEGSNNQSSSRNLQVANSSSGAGILFRYTTGFCNGFGVENSTVRNVSLVGTTSSNTASVGIALAGSSPTTAGQSHHNNSLINNELKRWNRAIFLAATSTSSDNLSIQNNVIGSSVVAEYLITAGIEIQRSSNSVVQNNRIFNVRSGVTTNGGPCGIAFSNSSASNYQIRNNFIYGIYSTSGAYGGKGIRVAGTNGILANNIIADIGGAGATTTANALIGIQIQGTNNTIEHNTVYLYGDHNGNSTLANISAPLLITSNSTVVRNNLLVNTIAPSGKANPISYCIYSTTTGANISVLDNNVYFQSGANATRFGFLSSTAQTTFANWRSAVGKDNNSYLKNPVFFNSTVSADTDLRPTRFVFVPSIGSVTADFGAVTRLSRTAAGAWEAYTNQWMGSNNTDFNLPANWTWNSVPANGDDFGFAQAAMNNAHLDQNRNYGIISFGGSTRKLDLTNFTLSIDQAELTSDQAYFLSSGDGVLSMSLDDLQAKTFPVGNLYFNPLTITNRTGAADVFSVRVLNGVRQNGVTGPFGEGPRIQATWDINKQNPNGGSGVDLLFSWNAAQNDRITTPALFHYATSWDPVLVGTATFPSSTSLQHAGYQGSFSPFAIGQLSGTLPVVWKSFSAEKRATSTQLVWETSSESNTLKYVVEHSGNGRDWKSIGEQSAAGNSNALLKYHFEHTRPIIGLNYYRIRQVDWDGKYTFSTVEIVRFDQSVVVKLHPNPAHTMVVIEQQNNNVSPATLRLMDIHGKVLKTINLTQNRYALDVSNLSAGMYFIQINQSTPVSFLKQ